MIIFAKFVDDLAVIAEIGNYPNEAVTGCNVVVGHLVHLGFGYPNGIRAAALQAVGAVVVEPRLLAVHVCNGFFAKRVIDFARLASVLDGVERRNGWYIGCAINIAHTKRPLSRACRIGSYF